MGPAGMVYPSSLPSSLTLPRLGGSRGGKWPRLRRTPESDEKSPFSPIGEQSESRLPCSLPGLLAKARAQVRAPEAVGMLG